MTSLYQQLYHGLVPALATPLQEDNATVNTTAIPPLVNFLLDRGVHGLFVAGSTGEGLMLAHDQRLRLFQAVMDAVAGRVPVLLHIGANNTAEAIYLAQQATPLNAAAHVAITPTFFPLPDSALTDYFVTVANAAPHIPFMLYDIPHLAINGITPQLLTHLITAIPNLVGLKTSRPDAQMVRALCQTAPENFICMAGNERIALGALALGATGLISGLATAIPEPFVHLISSWHNNDIPAAQQAHQQINHLLDMLPPARLGAIKAILNQRGLNLGHPIPPRPAVTKSIWPPMAHYLNLT
ncbi:MAG TPA: dihydrodipicolinate synthase family protein [Anaerolineae bacterium]|nr:dihydrodipicolinate synthase family protein [Anaerolineae bacterium]